MLTDLSVDAMENPTIEDLNAVMRRYMESVLNSLQTGVIVLDADFHIAFFNRSQQGFFRRMGVEPSLLDLIGAPVARHVPLLTAPDWAEARVAVERATTLTRTRLPWPPDRPDGFYEVSVFPIQHDGAAGAICTIEDISPLVKLEHDLVREERMALVGQMAIALNHEINNPLMVVMGQAEAVLMTAASDPVTVSAMQAIQSAGHRISRVTRKLRLMEEIQLTQYVKDGPMMVDLSDGPRP
ncbi:MAG: histidine kinase dimerization/phospho-acceptor domain-containing protein [Vicinamibacterales bacterium]|nr:histidine kinase dimerization/phospho-acceptor domain-containing protein [Vicinamibacterales bacterium]